MQKSRKPFWFKIFDRYSRVGVLRKRPRSGSVAVVAFFVIVPATMYIIGAYPMLHKDRFKGLQKKASEQ
ncbi:unnamed protein product [Gongylonema pulchrum]|uniref:Uncharacterized protein n=1 Tax=Gongylonema pulchrum TaxID=637853 RepID=A0A183DV91_9BILA|nr:unnamed protein product [Gongylonema pulchrum]